MHGRSFFGQHTKTIFDREYPNKRIEELNQILSDLQTAEQSDQKKRVEFNQIINDADGLLAQKKYNEAKTKYNEALALYENEYYAAHLKSRGNKQHIMLGFSDGTKDGGYLMANWSIFKAKEDLTLVAREHDVKVVFFDGRGGPPARGGGKTHKFYASLGSTIENNEIQITIQGQTISSNFGTPDSGRYNLENLISAGITNGVFNRDKKEFTKEQRELFDKLATLSYEKYTAFKGHDKFVPYLEKMSTLNYYAKTNIGSRPSKRNKSA